jgi:hypothetical protein
MTLYAAKANEISPIVIVGLGVVAFTFSTLEVILDVAFPRQQVERQ